MELIEKHQLVTEYVGEAITQEEAEERGKVYDSCGQTYLFDLDFNEGECLYTLDAKKYGNISHFINHSVRKLPTVSFGRDPFNQNFRKFRSKTQWIGSVQPEKFWKNGSTFWGGPLFPDWTGWNFVLVEWIAPFDINKYGNISHSLIIQ